MVEKEEPKEPTKIRDQIKHDEELTQRLDAQLQAKMEKEDRLAKQREKEDNIVSWDNAQAMMEVEDETEQVELKECFEIIPFDEDAVNTIPLATKQAHILDYKINKDARKIYYHITRTDGSTKVYMRFKDMLKMFDREDLEVLYRIVKDRGKSTSCHKFTYRRMWEGKLQVNYECEMAFKLLRRQKQVLKIENLGKRIAFLENEHSKSFAKCLCKESELHLGRTSLVCTSQLCCYLAEIIVVNLDTSSDNNNSDSYSTSQISTSKEIDYDSPEPPKSLLKWYNYLSDVNIEKAKACMLAKAQACEASSKAKVEVCGSKVKVESCGSTICVGHYQMLLPWDELKEIGAKKSKLVQIRQRGKERCHVEAVHALAFDQKREFKKLKRSRIAIVKVWWNSKRGLEFTWEREDQMKLKYPHLYNDVSS
ncbi:hypothetical protein Tco_0304430 [Tanacetum coccineum]